MPQPDISVIIVNWNTKPLLRQCLASVRSETHCVNTEIFVVDNASMDGSPELVEQVFPEVHLLRNSANIGFAAANNQAMRQAKGKVLVLLNSDAYVTDGALDKLFDFLSTRPEVAVVGPRILTPAGEIQPSCFRFPTLWDIICESLFLSRLFPRSSLFNRRNLGDFGWRETREVDWVLGACMMVRREVLEKVGLMDEGFFMYAEEADWCYRMKQAGYRIFFSPDAEVVHCGGQSSRQAWITVLPRGFASRFRYFEKHFGIGYARAVRAVTVVGMALRLVFILLVLLFTRDQEHADRVQAYWGVIRKALGSA